MEFVVEILATIFGDVLLGALVSLFDGKRSNDGAQQVLRQLGFAVLGAVFGVGSAISFPSLYLQDETWRRAWLMGSPVCAGLSVLLFHTVFFRAQNKGWPMVHGATLAFVFTLTRYLILS
ncbi:MAG: hypothetical protein QM817_39070 [Archangium sp.]